MKNGFRYIVLVIVSGIIAVSCVRGDNPINRPRNTRNTEGGLAKLGEGWSKVNISPKCLDVYFVNDTVGYLCGEPGILQSFNGGISWTKLTSAPAAQFYNLFFLDAKTGWAVSNGAIARTVDSGKTWTSSTSSLAGSFSDVHFIDENIGFASCANGVLKSTDGGVSWTKLNSAPVNVLTLKFSDATNGLIGLGDNTKKGDIYRTTDGENFTKVTGVSPSYVYAIQYIKGDPQKAVAITLDGKLWKTIDGGANWTSDKRFSDNYFDLNFLDLDNGFVSMANKVYKVEGASSSLVLYVPMQDEYFAECHFTDDLKRGWVIYTAGELYRYVKP